MPSSSDAVATSARSVPDFSRCSASSRRSFERLLWWQVTCSSPSTSVSRAVIRSASLRVLTKIERRAMGLDEPGDLAVDFVPLLVRANGRKRRRRHLDRNIHRPAMADIDQLAFAPGADEEPADFAERLLSRRQADALEGDGESQVD